MQPEYTPSLHRGDLIHKLRLKIDRIRKKMLRHKQLHHRGGRYSLTPFPTPTAPASVSCQPTDPSPCLDDRLTLRRVLRSVPADIIDIEYAAYLQQRHYSLTV
jgi:hypothetical protein